MGKRLLIIALLFVSMVTTSNLAWSATPWVYVPGAYAITGGTVKAVLKVVVDAQKLFDFTVNFYNIGILGDTSPVYFSLSTNSSKYYYTPFEGDFSLTTSSDPTAKGLLTGYWAQKGPTSFAVDTDLTAFYDSLMGSLGSMNVSIDHGDHKDSFTGTISKDGLTIKGKYSLTVPFTGITTDQTGGVDLSGTSLIISGTYVAQYEFMPTITSHSSSLSLAGDPSKAGALVKTLAEIIKEKLTAAVKKK